MVCGAHLREGKVRDDIEFPGWELGGTWDDGTSFGYIYIEGLRRRRLLG
jgi:hypothetical protein